MLNPLSARNTLRCSRRCQARPTIDTKTPLSFDASARGDRLLPPKGGSRVEVTDGNGEGVGGVGRVGRSIEIEEARDHVLHLFLVSAAVADYSGLDGERCVFGDGEPGAGGSQHGNSADVAEFERGLYVDGEENVFDGDFLGLVALDDGLQALEDFVEAVGDGGTGGGVDGADGDAVELSGEVKFDDTVASV